MGRFGLFFILLNQASVLFNLRECHKPTVPIVIENEEVLAFLGDFNLHVELAVPF